MNTYPQELVTPPLALVALLGCPQLHPAIGEYLRGQHRPPINSVGLAEPWAAGRLFGERKGMLTALSERSGILKAGWFAKHRKRRPAVAVLLLERANVTGEANAWATACSAMEAVKNAARARSAKTVVMIVGSTTDLPEERQGAIARLAGIDRRYIHLFSPEDGVTGLRALGKLLYEAASQFYLDSARRQISMHAERRGNAPERNTRVHFKAAALAEFRADWATAVKTYQSAYSEIARVPLGSEFPLQRTHEIAAVAELIHIKIVTLLLHQQRLPEALAQFKEHMKLFRLLPFDAHPAFSATHFGWVVRQYTVMGELMIARADSVTLQGEASPTHLFLWAAEAAVTRRKYAQAASELRGGQPPLPLEQQVASGEYVGQMVAVQSTRHLSDDEFVHVLEVKEAGVQQGKLAVEALDLAKEVLGRMDGRGSRQAYHIGRLLAKEHIGLGDHETALRLLLPIAGIYRREGWHAPLAGVGKEVRECANKLGYVQEEILYSLELSTLQHGLEQEERRELAQNATEALQRGPSDAGESKGAVELVVGKMNHPLHTSLHITAGFQALSDSSTLPKTLSLGVHLYNLLPVSLPCQHLQVAVKSGLDGTATTQHIELEPKGQRNLDPNAEVSWQGELSVVPGSTLLLTDIKLQITTHCCIVWSQDGLPGTEQGGHGSRMATSSSRRFFSPGLYEVTVPITAEPPRVEISSDPYALVGETLLAQLEVFATIALKKPTVKVFGGFMEDQKPLAISITPTEGATWKPADEKQQDEEEPDPRENMLGNIVLDSVPKASIKVLEVQIPLQRPGQLRLAAHLDFSGQEQEGSEGLQASMEIEAIKPFNLSTQFCTAPQTTAMVLPSAEEGHGVATLPLGSPCHLVASLQLQAPTQIQIHSLEIEAQQGLDVRLLGPTDQIESEPTSLRKGDIFTAILELQASYKDTFPCAGHLVVRWRRSRFAEPELGVTVDVAGQAFHGKPFPLRIGISNQTALLQQVKLAVSDAQGFVIAGMRHDIVNVLPRQTYSYNLTLLACQAGVLRLPQCKILSTRYNAVLEPLAEQEIVVSPEYEEDYSLNINLENLQL